MSTEQSWGFMVKRIESTYPDPCLWQRFLGRPAQFLISWKCVWGITPLSSSRDAALVCDTTWLRRPTTRLLRSRKATGSTVVRIQHLGSLGWCPSGSVWGLLPLIGVVVTAVPHSFCNGLPFLTLFEDSQQPLQKWGSEAVGEHQASRASQALLPIGHRGRIREF